MELAQALEEELVARAQAAGAVGGEACGLLLGSAGGALALEQVLELPNRAQDPTRAYRLDPGQVAAALAAARARGLDLAGFWHSHPQAPPVPSAADRAAAWPRSLHLVVGREAGAWRVRAWRLGPAGAREVPLERGPQGPLLRQGPVQLG